MGWERMERHCAFMMRCVMKAGVARRIAIVNRATPRRGLGTLSGARRPAYRRKIDYVWHVRRWHLMFTRDIPGFEVGGRRRACLAGDEAEAKRLAGWKAAWEPRARDP